MRLGNEINHDVADVMLVVKPLAYRHWLSSKAKTRTPKPVGRPGTADEIVALLPSVPGQERTILLAQACASLADPRVKQSEVRSLSEAMVELAVAEGTIVTWLTDETISVGFGTIQVVPVWRFLLEMELRT